MAWKQLVNFDVRKMGTRKGYCLYNVRLGYGIPGKYPSAKADMEANRKAGTLHDISTCPKNVAVPIYTDTASPYEHIMVSDHGAVYSDGKYVTSVAGMKFFGWGEMCEGIRVVEQVPDPAPAPASGFLPAKGYWGLGDTDAKIGKLADFMYRTFPAYTRRAALGNYFGPNLKSSIVTFQKKTGLEADGNVGPKTYAKLQQYGFKI